MKRIMVIGSGGSGKSTFARKLHKKLSIELIHLDKLFWQPDWVEHEKSKWSTVVQEEADRDSWIIDGNYNNSMQIRIDRADTVIYFDIPRIVCLLNALKRSLSGIFFNKKRSDMADGCRERIDFEFYKWIWNFNGLYRDRYLKMLSDLKGRKRVYIIRNYRDSKRVFDSLTS